MYQIIFDFLSNFHGSDTAPGFDLFVLIGSYLILGLLLMAILIFIIFIFAFIRKIIKEVLSAFNGAGTSIYSSLGGWVRERRARKKVAK